MNRRRVMDIIIVAIIVAAGGMCGRRWRPRCWGDGKISVLLSLGILVEKRLNQFLACAKVGGAQARDCRRQVHQTFLGRARQNAKCTGHLQLAARSFLPTVPFVDEQRSEEHTSELQSLTNLVCRLLLEKKKKKC